MKKYSVYSLTDPIILEQLNSVGCTDRKDAEKHGYYWSEEKQLLEKMPEGLTTVEKMKWRQEHKVKK